MSKKKLNEILSDLDKMLEKYLTEHKGDATDLIMSLSNNIGHYSWFNQLLIRLQCPYASHLKTFQAWKRDSNNILKGARAITVFAPIIFQKEVEDKDTHEKKNVSILAGFRPISLFDVSQTKDGYIPPVKDDTKDAGTIDNPQNVINVLKSIAEENGIKVVEEELTQPGLYGCYCPAESVIKLNTKMNSDTNTMISTFIHELTHSILHNPKIQQVTPTPPQVKEVEAESVASVVCTALGLRTTNFSVNYIVSYGRGVKLFRESLMHITKVSKTIMDRLSLIG